MSGARLDCPFCRTDVAAGGPLHPGRCPGCGARFAGDGESARDAVAAAVSAWGMEGVDVDAWTRELFELEPDDPAATGAVTSDRREGFYHWWVFVRDGS